MQALPLTIQQQIRSMRPEEFDSLALAVFQYQAEHNLVYKQYLTHIGCKPGSITAVEQIPFLPIDFFKRHEIKSGQWPTEQVFESSGTGSGTRSRHAVADTAFYRQLSQQIFEEWYAPLQEFIILALLPAYLERQHSSLVLMAQHFIEQSDHPLSGFYLYEYDKLVAGIEQALASGRKVLLLGVSFALLDLAERGPFHWPELMVMETGGMKGRRRELIREELHQALCMGFGVSSVHSEYGMTELLSQAYAKKNGVFLAPPWMRVYIREVNDPFTLIGPGRTGGINVADLANVHSCSFIETADLGLRHDTEQFEVLGRFDTSEARGCNLMLYN
jgi:hypothetical protein